MHPSFDTTAQHNRTPSLLDADCSIVNAAIYRRPSDRLDRLVLIEYTSLSSAIKLRNFIARLSVVVVRCAASRRRRRGQPTEGIYLWEKYICALKAGTKYKQKI